MRFLKFTQAWTDGQEVVWIDPRSIAAVSQCYDSKVCTVTLHSGGTFTLVHPASELVEQVQMTLEMAK